MSRAKCDVYATQGWLAPGEVKQILPRLESEKIRFQIQTDHSGRPELLSASPDSRVELFVHYDDLEAWQRIKPEYLPGK